jgi:hypothetical protein
VPANLDDIGLQSLTTGKPTLTNSFRISRTLKESPPLINADGEFVEMRTHDPVIEFSLDGKGDFPTALALGTDGGLTIDGISAGATVLTSKTTSTENEGWDAWSASGRNWPGATLVPES